MAEYKMNLPQGGTSGAGESSPVTSVAGSSLDSGGGSISRKEAVGDRAAEVTTGRDPVLEMGKDRLDEPQDEDNADFSNAIVFIDKIEEIENKIKEDKRKGLDPFARRDSINRTPPSERETTSATTEDDGSESSTQRQRRKYKKDSPPTDTYRGKKRKTLSNKTESSPIVLQSSATKTEELLSRNIKKMEDKIKTLIDFKNDNKSVHLVIKDGLEELRVMNKNVIREYLSDKERYKNIEKELKNELSQTKKEFEQKYKELEQRCTQLEHINQEKGIHITNEKETQTTTWNRKSDTVTKILETLPEQINIKEWEKTKDLKWDLNIIGKVKVKISNPLEEINTETKILLVRENNIQMTEGIPKVFRDRYPELIMANEEITILEDTIRIGVKGTEQIKSKRRVIKAKVGEGDEGVLKALELIKEELKEEKIVSVNHVEGMAAEQLQKMIAWILTSSNTEALIHTTERLLRETVPNIGNKILRNTYALTVEKKGVDNKTLLGNIRQGIKNSQGSEAISSVSETRGGKLIITLSRDQKALKDLTTTIREIDKNIKTKTMGLTEKTATLHIRGIDCAADINDVRIALEETIGSLDNRVCRIGTLRPNIRGTLAVSVTTSEEDANRICSMPIRIGLSRCIAEKRIEVNRCYRCWEYGHKVSNCERPDRSKNCYRCGKEGHVTSSCNYEEFCVICDKEGHTTNSGRCPSFREELNKLKMRHHSRSEGDDKME